MAQKVLVQLIDDLDGTTSDDIETVQFALDGVTYEMDLSQANAARLREGLVDFVASARRSGGRAKRGGSSFVSRRASGSARSKEQTKAIREWAKAKRAGVSCEVCELEVYQDRLAGMAVGGDTE